MEEHVQRMVTEKEELGKKLGGLGVFTSSSNKVFLGLPVEEQSDMLDQLQAMEAYYSILSRRIERATK